jgi:exodeoxyribonuclease VII small subunit
MTDKATDALSFEDALSELESLVERMEQGELSLEDSLASFERGIALTRTCQQALKDAEQKVEILTREDPDAEPEPFDSEG